MKAGTALANCRFAALVGSRETYLPQAADPGIAVPAPVSPAPFPVHRIPEHPAGLSFL